MLLSILLDYSIVSLPRIICLRLYILAPNIIYFINCKYKDFILSVDPYASGELRYTPRLQSFTNLLCFNFKLRYPNAIIKSRMVSEG